MAIGWDNNSTEALGTEFARLFPNSGEYTYSGKICGPVPTDCTEKATYSYEIPLSGWSDNAKIVKSATAKSCNQEMLVTWFNSGNNLSYSSVLNNASIFEMKNIDECAHIIVTKDPITYPFITGNTSQYFESSGYTDSGYPKICANPCDDGDCSDVYLSGSTYQGHKIKYLPSASTIPSPCIVNNTALVEIYFPHNFDSDNKGRTTSAITSGAFSGNTILSAITFSEVEIIGDNAFDGCQGLKRIDWGHKPCNTSSKIKKIGKNAFYDCVNIETLCLEQLNNVEEIGDGAFEGCMNLSDLRLPECTSYSAITKQCFCDCIELTVLNIPSNIKVIEEKAFYRIGEISMCKVEIPSSVNKIGSEAFNDEELGGNALEVTLNWGISGGTLVDDVGDEVQISSGYTFGHNATVYVKEADKKSYRGYFTSHGISGVTVYSQDI